MDDPEALRAFGLELTDAADAISLPAFLAGPEVSTKADGSPVTAADTAIEELIRDRVRRRFPSHGVLGEEFLIDTRPIVKPFEMGFADEACQVLIALIIGG